MSNKRISISIDEYNRLHSEILSQKATIINITAENNLLANDRDGYVQLLTDQNARPTAEMKRLRAALEKAEDGFYHMANAIDDYDYHGPAPQCTGDIIGHREQFHRVHVEQLVKYAEECRAVLSG